MKFCFFLEENIILYVRYLKDSRHEPFLAYFPSLDKNRLRSLYSQFVCHPLLSSFGTVN